MTAFQQGALALAAIWLALVFWRFRTSTPVLLGGMAAITAYCAGGVLLGRATLNDFGLEPQTPWWMTLAWAAGGTLVMLAWSPLADRIAKRFYSEPPKLDAFNVIQKGLPQLVGGIVVAWILGGFMEELVFRGVVLNFTEAMLGPVIGTWPAAVIAIVLAALGAGLCHAYQGPRAMGIITQLSVLFGVLYVASGYNLWAAILCHGFYDTIAFIRFAMKKSKDEDEGSDTPTSQSS